MGKRMTGALLVCALLALAGCETTGDPNQGGLWGWSEEKSQQRIDERQARKATLEEEQQAEAARTAALESESAEKRAQRDALVAKATSLDKELAALQQKIRTAKASTDAAKRRQWELSTEANALQSKLDKARAAAATTPDVQAKQDEVKRLEAEIDRLLKEAEALSTL
ncbi:hypothetical protein [Paucidesulfovibrio longus]|uniref:hypothetical protein n=1 Tax=Paucidesulfovibrio longus TaxID=889 RepID=UPI0003B63094|nr:hypothetical protein [Paucidesulfovibrio longus]